MHGLQKRKVTGRNDTNSTNKLMAVGIIPYLCPKLHDAELLIQVSEAQLESSKRAFKSSKREVKVTFEPDVKTSI